MKEQDFGAKDEIIKKIEKSFSKTEIVCEKERVKEREIQKDNQRRKKKLE